MAIVGIMVVEAIVEEEREEVEGAEAAEEGDCRDDYESSQLRMNTSVTIWY